MLLACRYAGTAVIMGYNANLKVKHGVPPVGELRGVWVGRRALYHHGVRMACRSEEGKVELSAKTKARAAEKKAAKKTTA